MLGQDIKLEIFAISISLPRNQICELVGITTNFNITNEHNFKLLLKTKPINFSFNKLTDRFFKNTPWPEEKFVAPVVHNGK